MILIAALVLAAIAWAGVEMRGQHIESTGSIAQPSKIDNSAPASQPTQSAPTDRSENKQQDIKNTPAQPGPDGVQN
ncbi:hypothetical protein AB4Z52_25025 [Rhizobium sp. 2YAF20]|uniref:hypothetical protein n=1 Tax=Rhizobium sp. 2YAF20 TaxID=3233027 RepID=UPI003F9B8FB7